MAFADEAVTVNKPNGQHLRIVASAKEGTDDKWKQYRYTREEFPQKLLEVVAGLEPEVPDDEPVVEDDDDADFEDGASIGDD